MGGIGGLSLRVGGGGGFSSTKACTETGSVFFLTLEIVVGRGGEFVSACPFVRLTGFQSEPHE